MEAGGEAMAEGLLEKVPPESRARVRDLLDEPLLPDAVLRGEVDSYVQLYRDAQSSNEFLDPAQAEGLAERCCLLLDRLGPDASEDHRRLVQVAVRYFLIEDDGDDDMSIGGLDDDEAVVAAVEDLLAAESTD